MSKRRASKICCDNEWSKLAVLSKQNERTRTQSQFIRNQATNNKQSTINIRNQRSTMPYASSDSGRRRRLLRRSQLRPNINMPDHVDARSSMRTANDKTAWNRIE
jgi:hypothetical protein